MKNQKYYLNTVLELFMTNLYKKIDGHPAQLRELEKLLSKRDNTIEYFKALLDFVYKQ